jgi:hypothetical protein
MNNFFETDFIDGKAVMLIAGSNLTKTTAIITRIMSFCIGCTGSFYSVIAECFKNLIETGLVERNAVVLGVGACMLSVLTIALYSSTRQSRAPKRRYTRKKDASTWAREEKRKSLDKKVTSMLKHDYQSGNKAEDGNLSIITIITIVPLSLGKRPFGFARTLSCSCRLKQRIFCVLDKNDTFSSASGKPQKGCNLMSIM